MLARPLIEKLEAFLTASRLVPHRRAELHPWVAEDIAVIRDRQQSRTQFLEAEVVEDAAGWRILAIILAGRGLRLLARRQVEERLNIDGGSRLVEAQRRQLRLVAALPLLQTWIRGGAREAHQPVSATRVGIAANVLDQPVEGEADPLPISAGLAEAQPLLLATLRYSSRRHRHLRRADLREGGVGRLRVLVDVAGDGRGDVAIALFRSPVWACARGLSIMPT